MAKNAATQREHEKSLVRRAEFLDLLRGDPRLKRLPMSVRAACDQIGISRRTPIDWCQRDPAFAQAYEDAKEDAVDVLEDEAGRRAVHGVSEPVYQGGELVGHKQVFSDRLLETLLMGRRAAVFRPSNQVNVQTNLTLEAPSDRDVAKALALLVEEVKLKQTESVE